MTFKLALVSSPLDHPSPLIWPEWHARRALSVVSTCLVGRLGLSNLSPVTFRLFVDCRLVWRHVPVLTLWKCTKHDHLSACAMARVGKWAATNVFNYILHLTTLVATNPSSRTGKSQLSHDDRLQWSAAPTARVHPVWRLTTVTVAVKALLRNHSATDWAAWVSGWRSRALRLASRSRLSS